MKVSGNQAGTATFEVYQDWTLNYDSTTNTYSFAGSNSKEFTVAPQPGGTTTNFSTTGTVSVASGVPAGGPRTLTVGVFDITNSNATGAKLEAGKSATYSVTVAAPSDTTAPKVTAIARTTPSPTNTTGNLSWNVTFSENVAGVDASDFQLATTGLGGSPAILAQPDGVTGSGANYTVTASSGTGDGTLGLNLVDDNSIKDGANNVLVGATSADGGFTGEVYTIDRTAPTVTPTAVKLAANGDPAGAYSEDTWTNQSVRVTFTCADNTGGSGPSPASGTQTLPDYTAETSGTTATFSGTCVDNAGNTATSDLSFGPIKIDKTAPVISGADINQTTWRNTDLSANFTSSDALSGLAPNQSLGTDGSFTLTTSGESPDPNTPVTASKTVADNAGNSTTRTISALVDKTKPSLGIVDSNLASYDVCGTARPTEPTFNPTDVLSGLANQSSTWTNNTALSGLGYYTYKASATDNATNSAFYPGPTATEVKTYTVVPGAAYSGVQQPINNVSTGAVRSSFKLGSTIPVKFQLRCGTTPINNAVAKLWVSQQDSKPDTAVNETIATNSPDIGNTFRVTDAATGQYQFNLSTKSGYLNPGATTATQFSLGTYYLYISLDGLPKFQAAQIDFNK